MCVSLVPWARYIWKENIVWRARVRHNRCNYNERMHSKSSVLKITCDGETLEIFQQ